MLASSLRTAVQTMPARRAVRCFASATDSEHKLNLFKCVDKAHQGKALRDIIKLPPGALKGLKAGKADDMLAAFNITTIEDLGRWKHYTAARAIAVLAKAEDEGKRPGGAASNINGIVDKAFESASFTELLAAPPSALQGLAPWTDNALKELKVNSVGDLAKFKYAAWADSLTTLAAYERADDSSR